MITLKCASCGLDYQKSVGEQNRCLKRGLKSYCSRSCSTSASNKARRSRGEKVGSYTHLIPGSLSDEFSPFRFHLKCVRARHKHHGFPETDLTLEYLKELWEIQKGVCPLTGWGMVLPPTLTAWNSHKMTKDTASLDRIRPKEPYAKGNVRFISHIANMAKHVYSDEDVIEFCKAVSSNVRR